MINPPKKKMLPMTFHKLKYYKPFLMKKLIVAFIPTTKYNPRENVT